VGPRAFNTGEAYSAALASLGGARRAAPRCQRRPPPRRRHPTEPAADPAAVFIRTPQNPKTGLSAAANALKSYEMRTGKPREHAPYGEHTK
jgi:hypothetical protein